jgi:hypothetical protein
LTGKPGTVFSQFANLRPQRRIVSGILEEPHKLGFSAIVGRCGKDSTDERYKGQAGSHGNSFRGFRQTSSRRTFIEHDLADIAR